MVGGGCRGLALARELVPEGHAVRATTRSEARRAQIEAAGAECVIADPDRIGSLRYALDNVTLLLWLLGTAQGANVADLHGSRWAMMLEKAIDTTVRGVVYEAAGTVEPDVLATGRREGERLAGYNEIPLRIIDVDPRDRSLWVRSARAGVESLLVA
jgi:nucleoside-diphosphate-sugar epimerase